jgi:hypothetical protein
MRNVANTRRKLLVVAAANTVYVAHLALLATLEAELCFLSTAVC